MVNIRGALCSMKQLPDLYPGYATKWVETSIGEIYVRIGGQGPPLLLLHGYAQTGVMWHKIAPTLDQKFTLIIADLPGYSQSCAPEPDENHVPYTKRAMADVMIEVMESLGHPRFNLAGHDRGGRVAYRLALDHPYRLIRIAVLDIITIWDTWQNMDAALSFRIWNWTYLALPKPFPETMIAHDPTFFWSFKTRTETKSGTLEPFTPGAIEHYLAFFNQPKRISATCEDYRAGQSQDYGLDAMDQVMGKQISNPMLVLWGTAGVPSSESNPLDTWAPWATDLIGQPIDSGHFLAEENPTATARAMLRFFTSTSVEGDDRS